MILLSVVIYITFFENKISANDLDLAKGVVQDNPDFIWGATTSSYQFDGYNEKTAQKQIDIINDLGINTVRLALEREVSFNPFKINYDKKANDDFIARLAKDKKNIVLVVDGDIIDTADIKNFNQENIGYQMGLYAARRYKDKVKYFQIANEVTGTAIKPSDSTWSGPTFKGDYNIEYSTDRYNSLLAWLKGLQRGIRETDPKAKIVISGHWHLYFIINKLIQDGIDPDVIGWAWYSDDGLDITQRDIGDGQSVNLIQKLKSFKRPVWIIETNSTKGSYNEKAGRVDENYQASFFIKFIPNLLKTGMVDGIFAFPLFDTPVFADNRGDSESHWGLVKVKKDLEGNPSFQSKKAFEIFRDFILAGQK